MQKALPAMEKETAAVGREQRSKKTMSDFLRKYWFICLLSVGFISVLIYYVMDLNKDNVSGKSADGSDVVASLTIGNVTSETIFEDYQNYDTALLYNMYRNAVANESVETTSEMKSEAETYTKNLKAAMDSDSTGATRVSYIQQLANLGFDGEDEIYDYFITMLKVRVLDRDYVDENFDSLKETVTTSPKLISIITLEDLPNSEILSTESEEKKNNIDEALANGDSFASTATAFSENTDTAANEGFYGYVDSSNTDLDSSVLEAIEDLKKGETSEWITVEQDDGLYTMYLVHVDETDLRTMFDYDDDTVQLDVLEAFLNANSYMEYNVIAKAAAKLDIAFEDEDVKTRLEEYIATYVTDDIEEAEEDADKEEEDADEKEDSSSDDSKKTDDSTETDESKESEEADDESK